MKLFRLFARSSSNPQLTNEQRQMYASEATENFRIIPMIFSTPAPQPLSSGDLEREDIHSCLSEIGQFAELAHGKLPVTFMWKNMNQLMQPNFPLDGYDALKDSKLVQHFHGNVAQVQGYVAYQPSNKRLYLAFSGTSSPKQSLMNARTFMTRHPELQGAKVHEGFYKMYDGLRSIAFDAVATGLKENPDTKELVVTGHSLGGVMSCLFTLDLLLRGDTRFDSIALKVAIFGSPRVGNDELVKHFRRLVSERKRREKAIDLYSVKAYNDGATMIPPFRLGFRHLIEETLFYYHNHLYKVPPNHCEWSIFTVNTDGSEDAKQNLHPKGGHNYYNNRDMEKLLRRMQWVNPEDVSWAKKYEERRSEEEIS